MSRLLDPLSANEPPSITCCRALAVLYIVDHAGRENVANKLASIARSDEDKHVDTLVTSGGLDALCFLARAALGLGKAREGLEVLAVKDTSRASVASHLKKCSGLILEVSCTNGKSNALLSLLKKDTEVDRGLRNVSIRKALDASQGFFKRNRKTEGKANRDKEYKSDEIDAVFYEATGEDAARYKPLWSGNEEARDPARVAVTDFREEFLDEDYYIEMQTRNGPAGGIATMIANALALDPSASDDFVYSVQGLLALRKLLLYPPDSVSYRPAKHALLRAEIARAVANLVAGSADIHRTAHAVVSAGFVPLLSHWTTDSSLARGHLQSESFRALHNLTNALYCDPMSNTPVRASVSSPLDVRTSVGCKTCSQETTELYSLYPDGVLPLQHPRVHFSGKLSPVAALDVVFVHGIRGSPLLTWRTEGRLPSLKDVDSPITVWPRDWLAEDVPKVRILSIGYDASIVARPSSPASSSNLARRAEALSHKLIQAGVGRAGIVFVTHSYGGLLVKQLLCSEDEGPSELFKKTDAVVFFATPHRGSPFAKQGKIGVSTAVKELLPGPLSPLLTLNDLFVSAVKSRNQSAKASSDVIPCEVLSVGEGGKTQIASQWKVELVPPESSDPGVGKFVVYEGIDHQQVCKPSGKGDGRYRSVKELIERALLYHNAGYRVSA